MDYAAVAAQLAELCRVEIQKAVEPLLARITALENAEAKEAPPAVQPQPRVIVIPPVAQPPMAREITIHRDSSGRMAGAVSRPMSS